jgi:CubicO group peptidase (beta-lactamase class C family)
MNLATAQKVKNKPSFSKVSQIDRLVQTYADNYLFNGSALVAEKGKIVFKKGFGSANMELNVPNSAATKFRIGSVTKQFTAMLILRLKQAGELDLRAKITDYLPWYRKDTGSRITVHHLLTHTSGIPNYTESAAAIDDLNDHHYSFREIAEKYCGGELEFEPGTKFKYNNSGYFLLGVIIETITKKTYAQNLREQIFEPLGMKNSGIDSPSEVIASRATGYEYGFEGYENASYIDMEAATYAAGAIYSTVEDLYRWQTALFGGKLLSKENNALMFAPNLGRYGYGLYVNQYKPPGFEREITAIGHSGGINGFSALSIRFLEDDITVILLDNTRVGKRGNLENISAGILAILNDLQPGKIQKSIKVAMTEKLKDGSGEDSAALYRRFKTELKNDYNFDGAEAFLNNLGYFLLGEGRVKDSLAVLKLAVEEFPLSANTFDTYAEALMKDGQKALAVANYRRSLELNPNNTNAAEQLKKLESTP